MPDMYGQRPRLSGTASDSNSFGGYPQQWAEFNPSMFGNAAAAQPASSGDKRKRSDPRLNCIKSVQYRVSRFPVELHDMCIEHWERTRCARVVCNGVNGVMSVQGGRCVVSFTQHGQEVLKGVADYLRYAGEDRIKKWRRHVRMVGEYMASYQQPACLLAPEDVPADAQRNYHSACPPLSMSSPSSCSLVHLHTCMFKMLLLAASCSLPTALSL